MANPDLTLTIRADREYIAYIAMKVALERVEEELEKPAWDMDTEEALSYVKAALSIVAESE